MDEKDKEKKGDLTVREAGRIGGKKGGQTTRERYGRPFYEQIGRKGGETVRETHGHEFYEEIGRKGGRRVRELIEQGKRAAQQQKETPKEPPSEETEPKTE
jgi:general stress protein YciG